MFNKSFNKSNQNKSNVDEFFYLPGEDQPSAEIELRKILIELEIGYKASTESTLQE